MPTLPKIKKAKPGKSRAKGSAIDSAQRELNERQNQLQAQIDALQRSLQTDSRGSAGTTRSGRGMVEATPTRRYAHHTTVVSAPVPRPAPKRPTMLRAERIAARRQTMALLVFLAAAVIYAMSHLLP